MINYTIVATNDGNVTLTNVTVTDPNVGRPALHAGDPVASLAPGASITCTAIAHGHPGRHRRRQLLNAACVDDGAGWRAEACDDVTTPGSTRTRI